MAWPSVDCTVHFSRESKVDDVCDVYLSWEWRADGLIEVDLLSGTNEHLDILISVFFLEVQIALLSDPLWCGVEMT